MRNHRQAITALTLFVSAGNALAQSCEPVLLSPIDIAPGLAYGVDLVGDTLYVASTSPDSAARAILIYDVSSPGSPSLLGELPITLDSGPVTIAIDGNTAFATTSTSLFALDVTNPTTPQVLGSIGGFGSLIGISVSGGFVSVADLFGNVTIVDASDPAALVIAGSAPFVTNAHSVVAQGPYLYATSNLDGLYVIDATNPANPTQLSQRTPPNRTWHGLALDGSTVYLTENRSLVLLDVSNPESPTELGQINLVSSTESVCVKDNAAFVASFNLTAPANPSFDVVDVADPQNPTLLASLSFESLGLAVDVGPTCAFVATGRELVQIIDVSFCLAAECVADVNGDGLLTPADFTAWIAAFNAATDGCDQNDDNACTPADFTAWIANFNAGC